MINLFLSFLAGALGIFMAQQERYREELRISSLKLDYDEPNRFLRFEFGKPNAYIVWRFLWAVYHVTWLIKIGCDSKVLSLNGLTALKWFIYLTNWGYLTLTVDVCVQFVVVAYTDLKRPDIVNGTYKQMTWYLKLAWLISSVSNALSVGVTVLFWTLLYHAGEPIGLANAVVHAFNTVYVILNMSLSAFPVRVLHGMYPMIMASVYATFSLVYDCCGGTDSFENPYIYSVFDWSAQPKWCTFLSFVSVFVLGPLIQLLLFAIFQFRCHIFKMEFVPTEDEADADLVVN